MTTCDIASRRLETLRRVLDLARWAPSGDNTQPWRFEIAGDDHIVVRGFDTREWCLYDFDGHASQMAHGALLETLRVAATGSGIAADWRLRPGCPDTAPIYDVALRDEPGLQPDPLLPFIETRVVQRRPMKTTPLTEAQRRALAQAPGADYEVRFFESFDERLKLARLLWNSAYIRLTSPEAYEVHRKTIEWGARYSADRIPERAVGVDPMTGRLMKWVLGSWNRVEFFNRFMLGTVMPRIQLDFLPALGCAAHLLLQPKRIPADVESRVRAGVAMQRLWLTAAATGLHLQPEMTPVIFRWYARGGKSASKLPEIDDRVRRLADAFETVTDAGTDDAFAFFCRVGTSAAPAARSQRKGLDELLVSGS